MSAGKGGGGGLNIFSRAVIHAKLKGSPLKVQGERQLGEPKNRLQNAHAHLSPLLSSPVPLLIGKAGFE